jgi:hypothetical protein
MVILGKEAYEHVRLMFRDGRVHDYRPRPSPDPSVLPPSWADEMNTFDTSIWDAGSWLGGWNGEFHFYTGPPSNRSRNVIVENGTLYLQPDLTANFRPGGKSRLGWNRTLGCGRSHPSDASSVCLDPTDHPHLELNTPETGNCAVPWDESKCKATAGKCKDTGFWGCSYSVLPPVTSATMRTRRAFRFGRLEIRARLPRGDWLWPALWLLPEKSVYGGWPASGGIDIMEARGNDGDACGKGKGNDGFGSTLHFGPDSAHNYFMHTHTEGHVESGESLADDFHVYGLEWGPKGLYTYIDDPADLVLAVEYANANESFWQRAQTSEIVCAERVGGVCTQDSFLWSMNFTGNDYKNPWVNGTPAAPFDQDFFLQMNLAVGGTGGYFPDPFCQNKPWWNGAANPQADFLAAFENWWPTWGGDVDRPELGAARSAALAVDWVRYWEPGVDPGREPAKSLAFAAQDEAAHVVQV